MGSGKMKWGKRMCFWLPWEAPSWFFFTKSFLYSSLFSIQLKQLLHRTSVTEKAPLSRAKLLTESNRVIHDACFYIFATKANLINVSCWQGFLLRRAESLTTKLAIRLRAQLFNLLRMNVTCFRDRYMKKRESIVMGKWSLCSLGSTFQVKNSLWRRWYLRSKV